MNPFEIVLLIFGIGVLPGVAFGYFFGRQRTQTQHAGEDAGGDRETPRPGFSPLQEEQRQTLLEAKDESAKIRAQLENEARERKQDLKSQQQRLTQKEEEYDRKIDQMEKRDRQISQRVGELDQQKAALEELRTQRLAELQRVGQLTIEEARAEVIRAAEEVAQRDASRAAREIEARARDEAEVKAREIVTLAIQRCASDQVSEVTLSVVPLPNDEMKGASSGARGATSARWKARPA